METKKELAIRTFRSGMNCAQSVITAFAPSMDADTTTLLRVSSGFGAGMGRLQKTCGAITGAFMVIGLAHTRNAGDQQYAKEKNVELIRSFNQAFMEKHRNTDCSELLKCDLNTGEGQEFFSEQRLGENVCEKCIATAVDILDDLLG